MPRKFSEVKKKFLSELWLKTVVKAGSIRYPTRKRNKQMTMLTLTNADELSEIYVFLSNKIIVKEGVLAWNYSFLKVMRLETELQSVAGKSRYERSICDRTHEARRFFPKEIINLDFTSQDPQEIDGRIENELQSVEETLSIQSERVVPEKVFVIIYTTLIDSRNLLCDRIAQNSNAKVVSGWLGLDTAGFQNQITDANMKMRVIKNLLNQFSSKYGLVFDIEGEMQEQVNGDRFVYSIAGIVRKR
jgi:hypothetical protein